MKDILAKITARNRVNAQVNELAPVILEALKPFVGTKITLQTGGFAAKIKSVLDGYLGNDKIFPKLQIYNNPSNYSLSFVFKTDQMVGEFSCIYQEEYVYFASMEGYVLKELALEFTPRRTDFNIEQINEWRAEYRKADNIKSNMQSNLTYFGVY